MALMTKLRRQILSCIVAGMVVCFVFAGVGYADGLKGDCNGDGSIKAIDALLALQYAANLIPHTTENDLHYLTCADVYPLDGSQLPASDGQVRAADALVILQRAANLISFNVSTPSAIVRVATSGTLPTGKTIGVIQFTVNYTNAKGLSMSAADVTGVGSFYNNQTGTCTGTDCSLLTVNPNIPTDQAHPNPRAVVAIINAKGLASVGDLLTLNFHTAQGSPAPIAGDFTISDISVYDAGTFDAAGARVSPPAAIPGVTVVINGVGIQ